MFKRMSLSDRIAIILVYAFAVAAILLGAYVFTADILEDRFTVWSVLCLGNVGWLPIAGNFHYNREREYHR